MSVSERIYNRLTNKRSNSNRSVPYPNPPPREVPDIGKCTRELAEIQQTKSKYGPYTPARGSSTTTYEIKSPALKKWVKRKKQEAADHLLALSIKQQVPAGNRGTDRELAEAIAVEEQSAANQNTKRATVDETVAVRLQSGLTGPETVAVQVNVRPAPVRVMVGRPGQGTKNDPICLDASSPSNRPQVPVGRTFIAPSPRTPRRQVPRPTRIAVNRSPPAQRVRTSYQPTRRPQHQASAVANQPLASIVHTNISSENDAYSPRSYQLSTLPVGAGAVIPGVQPTNLALLTDSPRAQGIMNRISEISTNRAVVRPVSNRSISSPMRNTQIALNRSLGPASTNIPMLSPGTASPGGSSNIQNRDVDVDRMSYEELLQLEEMMGDVPRGAMETDIQALPETTQNTPTSTPRDSAAFTVPTSPAAFAFPTSPTPPVSPPATVSSSGMNSPSDDTGLWSVVSNQSCDAGMIRTMHYASYIKNMDQMGTDMKTDGEEEDNNGDENKQCSICLEDYGPGEKVKTLPCMHMFHSECIDKWLRIRNSCPVCGNSIGIRGATEPTN